MAPSYLFLRQCVQCILSVCETNTPLYCCTTTPVTALPSPLVVKLLDSLLVQCKNGCGEYGTEAFEKPLIAPQLKSSHHSGQPAANPTPSQMQTHTLGLLVDKLMPTKGSIKGMHTINYHPLEEKLNSIVATAKSCTFPSKV